MITFKEYLQEAKYYKQKDVYTHVYTGDFSVEVLSWEYPYGEQHGAIVTVRDTETGKEQVYSEEEFLSIFQKVKVE